MTPFHGSTHVYKQHADGKMSPCGRQQLRLARHHELRGALADTSPQG